jgi:hypothetical protein
MSDKVKIDALVALAVMAAIYWWSQRRPILKPTRTDHNLDNPRFSRR